MWLSSFDKTLRWANNHFTCGKAKMSVPDTLKWLTSKAVSVSLNWSASLLELTTTAVVSRSGACCASVFT